MAGLTLPDPHPTPRHKPNPPASSFTSSPRFIFYQSFRKYSMLSISYPRFHLIWMNSLVEGWGTGGGGAATMAERRWMLTWSIPTIHPSSGHTPDVSVKALARSLLRQDIKFDSWSLPNWRKEGVHTRHLASWGSLQGSLSVLIPQEPMPWMPGLMASRNSKLVHSTHIVFPEHSWALSLSSFISYSVCSLLPHSCGFPILLSSPETPERISWFFFINWLVAL